MYTKSSQSLWLDLEQRYGDCNGPQLYQLQREICSMMQGNLPLSTYFTNMKRLWNEMGELKPTPQCTCNGCTCGAWNTVAESAAFTQLIQFLMGLNDTFDSVRHQLLVMDPAPTVNKAYSLIQSVEKQKRVHVELADNTENIALNIRSGSRFDKKRYNADKRTLHCTHCNKMRHSRDTCFRLHGTPDWYKELMGRRNKDVGSAKAYNVGTIMRPENQMQHNTKEESLQELIRLMKNNVQPEVQGNSTHENDFVVMDDFSRATWTFLLRYKSQTSCAYTPQQNKVVEHKHQHGLQLARALLFQAHLSKKFWGESVLTATYFINRLPTFVLHWKSPFEILYNKPPNLNHIKVFDCICFATNTSPLKHKFDVRASKCLFSGYCQSKKAYKIYDLDRHISFASRDVTFRESSFPFGSAHSTSDPVCLPIPFDDVETPCDAPVSTPPHSDFIPATTPSSPTLRRSQRRHSKPFWLTDYICNCSYSAPSCTPSSYSAAHRCFVANLSALQKPKSYL
ncbi:UNVERIFIED_CONTAM: hypothetical protein Sindi_1706700 [Sesamum indicum]